MAFTIAEPREATTVQAVIITFVNELKWEDGVPTVEKSGAFRLHFLDQNGRSMGGPKGNIMNHIDDLTITAGQLSTMMDEARVLAEASIA